MKKPTDKETITVSLWLGQFQTKKQLEAYVAVDYSDERDEPSLSPFWADYNINTGNGTRVDLDLQETGWKPKAKSIDDLLEGHSYADYVIDMVKAKHPDLKASDYNAVIQFIGDYKGTVTKTGNTVFLGSYTFDYEQPDYMKDLFD